MSDGSKVLPLKDQLCALVTSWVDRAVPHLEKDAHAVTLHLTLHVFEFRDDQALIECTPREEVQGDGFLGTVPQ